MTDRRILARRFETERPRLRAIATRLLGSAVDADDAVQETWLRLERADVADIENLEAWLTTVVSRISLDMLRAPRRKREHSWQVEPWRDEPIAAEADPADLVAQSDQVSVALLVLLETLSPAERIALVLHDVFGQSFDEIADVLERSPEAARQLASRARGRVRGAEEPARPDRERGRRIVTAWLAAARESRRSTRHRRCDGLGRGRDAAGCPRRGPGGARATRAAGPPRESGRARRRSHRMSGRTRRAARARCARRG